jgi:GT2 family glycosyltransferase
VVKINILIATPSYDGRVDVHYLDSLRHTEALGRKRGINFNPVFIAYDALVQRARNDLIKMAVEGGYDGILWIDSDMQWEPNWAIDLVRFDEDVIGGTCRKKTDDEELYVFSFFENNIPEINSRGLLRVKSLGTGFTYLSKKAIHYLWETSPTYQDTKHPCRMVFDVQIVDGKLYSEDTVIFKKLREGGFDVYLCPYMTCDHIGPKTFTGSFEDYYARVRSMRGLVG